MRNNTSEGDHTPCEEPVLIHKSSPPLAAGHLSVPDQPLEAQKLAFQKLLTGQGLLKFGVIQANLFQWLPYGNLNVLVQLIEVLGWYGCTRA